MNQTKICQFPWPIQVLLCKCIFTFTEIVNALVGKSVVIVLPRKLGLDEALGGQRLHSLDDLEVGNVNVGMLRGVKVLGSDQCTVYIRSSLIHAVSLLLNVI